MSHLDGIEGDDSGFKLQMKLLKGTTSGSMDIDAFRVLKTVKPKRYAFIELNRTMKWNPHDCSMKSWWANDTIERGFREKKGKFFVMHNLAYQDLKVDAELWVLWYNTDYEDSYKLEYIKRIGKRDNISFIETDPALERNMTFDEASDWYIELNRR